MEEEVVRNPGDDGGARGQGSGSRGSLLGAPTPFYNEALFARRKDTSADTTYTPRLFGAIDTTVYSSLFSSLLVPPSIFFSLLLLQSLLHGPPPISVVFFLPPSLSPSLLSSLTRFRLLSRSSLGEISAYHERRLTKILHLPFAATR